MIKYIKLANKIYKDKFYIVMNKIIYNYFIIK